MLQEFEKFAMKGSMVDMAVGIIIGAVFGTIIKSPVEDVIIPPIGVFISTVISFLIVAFSVFIVIRNMNRLKRQEEAPPVIPTQKNVLPRFSGIQVKATRCAYRTAELGNPSQ
jgi:large conductance mechanosensitive channel